MIRLGIITPNRVWLAFIQSAYLQTPNVDFPADIQLITNWKWFTVLLTVWAAGLDNLLRNLHNEL